jgi:hypothetical protein
MAGRRESGWSDQKRSSDDLRACTRFREQLPLTSKFAPRLSFRDHFSNQSVSRGTTYLS